MFARLLAASLALASAPTMAQDAASLSAAPAKTSWAQACEDWDEWDKPGPPFRIFGTSFYVGTCGIAAILIARDDGYVLIDTGTDAGADVVLANIRALGFDPRDIKLLLSSHEHFDHVGGMAKMQRETGADVISSVIGIDVMVKGILNPDDPQFGMHPRMASITHGKPFDYADAPEKIGRFGIAAIATPGHSPGAMSWSWKECEGHNCRVIVYADSLSAVSRDDYVFLDHPDYVRSFAASLDRVAALDCDIVLTPHPSASGMRDHYVAGDLANPGGKPCNAYAAQQRDRLRKRLTGEIGTLLGDAKPAEQAQ